MNKAEYQLPRMLTIGEGIQLFHEVIQKSPKWLYSQNMEIASNYHRDHIQRFKRTFIYDGDLPVTFLEDSNSYNKYADHEGKIVDYNLAINTSEILSRPVDHMILQRYPRCPLFFHIRFISCEFGKPQKLRLFSSSQKEIDNLKQGLDAFVQRVMA